MKDKDDTQIKAEIDKIMQGVRTTMQKINAVMPKKESEPETAADKEEDPNSFDTNNAGE
jgi:hypothetical protein